MTLKRWSALLIILTFFSLVLQPVVLHKQKAYGFSSQVIANGAVGDDVIELQARLQYLGFYKGKIDGVFGWGTYWALRNFQQQFGMKVDGLAGATVKQKLAKASKYDQAYVKKNMYRQKDFTYYGGNSDKGNQKSQNNHTPTSTPAGYSQNDIKLISNAVHGEARGEPYEGQVAVAAVILNRVDSSLFPNTISGVIFQPGAFTAVADGQIWLTPNETSKKAVIDAINGWDPSGSALYYFNPETATSSWIWSRPQIKRIGKHIFCN